MKKKKEAKNEEKQSNFIFGVTSREQLEKIVERGKCSPPLGKYDPKYDLLYENHPSPRINKEPHQN